MRARLPKPEEDICVERSRNKADSCILRIPLNGGEDTLLS